MTKSVYISGTGPGSGKTLVVLGVTELLAGHGRKVGFFRPLVGDTASPDWLTTLVASRFGAGAQLVSGYGAGSDVARHLLSGGREEELYTRSDRPDVRAGQAPRERCRDRAGAAGLEQAGQRSEPRVHGDRHRQHRGEQLKDGTAVTVRGVTVPDASGGETIIGAGRYFLNGPPGIGSGAEVAFTVEEDFRGQGIAGLLFRHLALIARQQGVPELTAEVLPGNRGMLAVFARSGLRMRQSTEDGVVHVALSLAGQDAPSGA